MFSGIGSALIQLIYLVGSFTTIQSYICQPPTAPIIVSPESGTAHPIGTAFTVSGTGPTESSIVISDNTVDVVSVQANESNQFSANVILTSEGEHTLSVKAVRSCGQAQGNEITVTGGPAIPPVDPVDPVDPIDPVDPTPPTNPSNPAQPSEPSTPGTPTTPETPPEVPQPNTDSDGQGTSEGLYLSIDSPANNSTTTDSSVFVGGSTNAPSTVIITVNGTEVARTLVKQSEFGMSVPLSVGANTIVVSATGDEGKASVQLTVTRNTTNQDIAWYQTETGQMTIRVAAVSLISILIVVVIIGIILL